jgi:hypothetical protein
MQAGMPLKVAAAVRQVKTIHLSEAWWTSFKEQSGLVPGLTAKVALSSSRAS